MSGEKTRHRIYIVGGKGKNIPPWISAAFDIEQFEQDHTRGRTPDPTKSPDAVVVLSSWVGHKHYYDAEKLAEKLSIPLILSPGGWSSSLKSAADLGAEWFINDIETAKVASEKDEKGSAEEFIDNAWREAYTREWNARNALEKHYRKLRIQLEEAQEALRQLKTKEAAAQRVIVEIRAAAAAQRRALEESQAETKAQIGEIRERSERVSTALAEFIASTNEMFTVADSANEAALQAATQLGNARNITRHKLNILNIAMTGAEDGHHDVTPEDEETAEPVSASNAELEA
jgi:DNA-binding transcriptional MerR regulator